MWYLVVNNESERFFIRQKESSDYYYVVRENTSDVKVKSIQKLKDNHFRMVGEAYENECRKLEKILKENEVI